MAKNDNAHSLRLVEALRTVADAPAADAFAESYPLSKSADAEKKFRWACEVCATLEAHFAAKAADIRRKCRCGDGTTMAKEIAGCINKAGSLVEGCVLFTQKNKYAFLDYVSENEVIFGYRACVCSCIKRMEAEVPQLWCECSAGYAEAMFRQLWGDSVHVELLCSVKAGAERCAFRVML